MKKLYCTKLDRPHEETEHCADSCLEVYLASEVDIVLNEARTLLRLDESISERLKKPNGWTEAERLAHASELNDRESLRKILRNALGL